MARIKIDVEEIQLLASKGSSAVEELESTADKLEFLEKEKLSAQQSDNFIDQFGDEICVIVDEIRANNLESLKAAFDAMDGIATTMEEVDVTLAKMSESASNSN